MLCSNESVVKKMSESFGVKMGIQGEREFKSVLKEINQSFKVLGSEMNLISSQFDKNDSSIEALIARNDTLNKSIDTQKEKILTLSQALENASTSFGENDTRTKNWAIQLNNAKAELNNMEKELEHNNQALDTSGKEFYDAEKQANNFGDEIKNSAEKADDASNRFEKLGSVVKGIGAGLAVGVAAIGAAAIGAGKALVDMTVNSSAYADEILTQASITGMSTENLQAYKYATELVDVSLDTLTGSMSKQIKSMSSARDGSASFVDAYKKLGVSVADSNGNLRDSDTVYWETIDALGKISNETERDALSMKIFGKSAQELNPLIDQGSAGIAKLTAEAKSMGAVMSDDSLNALGKFDDSIQRLKSGASSAQNALGTVLLPELQILADSGVSLLGDFTTGLNAASGELDKELRFSKISDVIGETVGNLATMLLESLPNIVQVGMDIVTSIGGAIIANLPLIIDSAVQIVMTLLTALIGALPQITEGALQLVMALLNGIIENLPMLVEGAIQMVVTLATGIANALPQLIPSIINAILLITQTLYANMDKILAAAFKIIEGLATGLLKSLPVLISALPQIITAMITYFVSAIPQIINLGINLFTSLIKALPEIIVAIVRALPQIVIAIVNGIGSLAYMLELS